MKFKLKDIKPNPFRNIDNYPIRKDKVAALRESIGHTGFWDNVVARQNNGDAEIAYGHHRLAALREEYGPSHVVEMIVRELDDESMIKIMARENMEEWGSNAQIEMETVKAVVLAFAGGKIKLRPIKRGGYAGAKGGGNVFRCAPSFLKTERSDGQSERYYDAQTVAEFIGWVNTDGTAQNKVKVALSALELAEKGALDEADLTGIGTDQARALVTQTSATLKQRQQSRTLAPTAIKKAREVSKEIAKTFRESKGGGARQMAVTVKERVDRRPKRIPNIDGFVERLNTKLFYILSSRDKVTEQILEVVKCVDGLGKDTRGELETQLRNLSERAKSLAGMVRTGKGVPQRSLIKLLGA